jgi:NAD(P)-dependent dehydrogenase (short-subunit alcohol dehydrogenase family)
MDLDLSGHVAIVTGASKGIGLAITRTLLGEGARSRRSAGWTCSSTTRAGPRPATGSRTAASSSAAAARSSTCRRGRAGSRRLQRRLLRREGDIIAAMTGGDREAVLTTVAPELMQLSTGRLADPQEARTRSRCSPRRDPRARPARSWSSTRAS